MTSVHADDLPIALYPHWYRVDHLNR